MAPRRCGVCWSAKVLILATYTAATTEEEHKPRFVSEFGQDVMLRLRLMDLDSLQDLVSKKRTAEQSAL